MRKLITTFIPFSDHTINKNNFECFSKQPSVKKTYFFTTYTEQKEDNLIFIDSVFSTSSLKKMFDLTDTEYLLINTKKGTLKFTEKALDIMLGNVGENNLCIAYSNYYEIIDKQRVKTPLTDYQFGSVRDDFNFGPLLLLNKSKSLAILNDIDINYKWYGLYALRLWLSINHNITKIPEFLYSFKEKNIQTKEEQQFDYLGKHNTERQKEAEEVFTKYLKKINAYICPDLKRVNLSEYEFENEASVIIPVKNRAGTIEDSVRSALTQKIKKNYNIIVVDNHSNDGTTEILEEISKKEKRLLHMFPNKFNLNIGGCWNLAINNANCGKFSVQLDSDDLYTDEFTLQRIIDKFYEGNYGMVIGSYILTDFEKNEIPPGVILHEEWTEENGHNNALRVNGFGAPRAFYTPLVRSAKFQNVSYGEDYAICLEISREYKVGRIFEPIYLCRRWAGNSDANLSTEKENELFSYKDGLRTKEIKLRIKLNKSKIE